LSALVVTAKSALVVDANRRRVKNLDMTIVEIAGGMLRAARSLTGLSQQELADRASISRHCLTGWEGSSDNVPNAKARALHRVVSALEAEGVRFSEDGVRLERSAPVDTVPHTTPSLRARTPERLPPPSP
jgi:DNA-binding transcriptional regulator YiaG